MEALSLPSSKAEFEEQWAFLEPRIDPIMTWAGTSLSAYLSFSAQQSIHTVVYNATTSRDRAKINPKMHDKLTKYFENHSRSILPKVESLRDAALLCAYAYEWAQYESGATHVDRLFDQLNRHWVKRERDEGRKSIFLVFRLALVQWRHQVFTPLQPTLTAAILRFVAAERDGESIDQVLLKKVVGSFVSLGYRMHSPEEECLDVYEDKFEVPFLAATEAYYRAEANSFLEANDMDASAIIPAYLQKVEGRLHEEVERTRRYLHVNTRKKLMSCCESVLVSPYAPRVSDAFQTMLDSRAHDDVQRMYNLFARTPDGLGPLQSKFQTHVNAEGLRAMNALLNPVPISAETKIDPRVYGKALLAVHHKNAQILTLNLEGEMGFANALDNACRDFVNRNAATGHNPAKSAELIATHANTLSQDEALGESNFQRVQDEVMILFKYLEDKDTFHKFCSLELSKRLIEALKASEAEEARMLRKLHKAKQSPTLEQRRVLWG